MTRYHEGNLLIMVLKSIARRTAKEVETWLPNEMNIRYGNEHLVLTDLIVIRSIQGQVTLTDEGYKDPRYYNSWFVDTVQIFPEIIKHGEYHVTGMVGALRYTFKFKKFDEYKHFKL